MVMGVYATEILSSGVQTVTNAFWTSDIRYPCGQTGAGTENFPNNILIYSGTETPNIIS
jgi:hypothetical protein